MDFITGLLLSKELVNIIKYDVILVIIDRFTKYGYFIPILITLIAPEFAFLFVKYIVINHGILIAIISDRDKLFISKF